MERARAGGGRLPARCRWGETPPALPSLGQTRPGRQLSELLRTLSAQRWLRYSPLRGFTWGGEQHPRRRGLGATCQSVRALLNPFVVSQAATINPGEPMGKRITTPNKKRRRRTSLLFLLTRRAPLFSRDGHTGVRPFSVEMGTHRGRPCTGFSQDSYTHADWGWEQLTNPKGKRRTAPDRKDATGCFFRLGARPFSVEMGTPTRTARAPRMWDFSQDCHTCADGAGSISTMRA